MGHDGSNDTGIKKMNPVCVRMFYIQHFNKVTNHFFNMCLTEGEDAAKASVIFVAVEQCSESENMPWNNCVSLSVDNTNAIIGKRNSVASRFINM